MSMIVLICLFPLLQKKKSALFEVAEVVPVMTNNYEENILKGVKDTSYSLESSLELLQKDVVQLHAPRYQSMRRVSVGSTLVPFDIVSWRLSCCIATCNGLSFLKTHVSSCLRSLLFVSHWCFWICTGCDRLYPGDGLYPLAPQWYWEDCLSPVLQMERGWTWTIQACSGMCT